MPRVIGLDDDLAPLVAALAAGQPTIIPTDTVYGLATGAGRPEACAALLALKGRDGGQPAAVICASVETLFATVLPELDGRAAVRARRLLPGPVTLVVPNPARRFAWLGGGTPERLGVRVPVLDARLAAALDGVGAVLATSANPTGAPAPTSLEAVDPDLLARVAVALDGGPTPGGAASTVVDVTGAEPVVLREGPLSAAVIAGLLAGT